MAGPIQYCLWICVLSLALLFACTPVPENKPPSTPSPPADITETAAHAYWIPSPSDSFQWQLSGYPVDQTVHADIYDIDLFETPQETIDELHASGSKVICYINVGAWESYRPDAGKFPEQSLGRKYHGWKGERWLDISNYEVFRDVILARLDLAVSKDFDGIEPDNISAYQEDTGFAITPQDQLTYNIWLAEQAHLRGLSIALKKDSRQAAELVDHFDFAIVEDCAAFGECEHFLPFTQQGKAIFQVEYTDTFCHRDDFCPGSILNGYYGILKNRALDAWRETCRTPY
jgi:hypothetical protein